MQNMPNANNNYPTLISEAVGIFENLHELDATVAELEGTAFARHDISVQGGRHKMEEKFGRDNVAPEILEDNPSAPRGIPIRPEEKTIGSAFIIGICAYACGILAAISVENASILEMVGAITGGSLIGAMIGGGIVYFLWQTFKTPERQIAKGGLVLWVKTPNADKEKLAQDIMRRHGGKKVHIHTIA